MKLIINFKTYKKATGKNAVKLAKVVQSVSKDIIIAVQAADIYRVSSKTKVKVIAQHVDDIEPGRHTGYILPEDVKRDGAIGTLLNHAEHRIPFSKLVRTIKRCKNLKLKTIVATDSLSQVKKLRKLKPYAIAFEDPKLIGTGRSITKSKSTTIKKFSKLLKGTKIIPLCGAGISTREDVKEAKKLGTKGVLVASGIVKAKNQRKALKELT